MIPFAIKQEPVDDDDHLEEPAQKIHKTDETDKSKSFTLSSNYRRPERRYVRHASSLPVIKQEESVESEEVESEEERNGLDCSL